jgi:hypothetical protein
VNRAQSAALVGVLVAALAYAGCGDTEPTHSASYSLPPVKSLEVTGEVGEVTVTAAKGASKIQVVEKRTDKAKPSHTASGSTAMLKYDCPGGFDVDTCRVDYDITVPETTRITVDNSAGEVSLNGPLTNFVANTDAGKVGGKALGGGTATASTHAGEVDLAFASPPRFVKTTTDAGATTITVPGSASYQVDASADVGDTDVKVPNDPSAPNRIQAKTNVGEITIRKGKG